MKMSEQHRDPRQQRPVADLADVEPADVVERHMVFRAFGLGGRAAPAARLRAGAAAAGLGSSGGAAVLTCRLSVNSLTRRSFAAGEGTDLISTSSGLVEPRRRLDVAHQRRDPRVRLRVADQRDLCAGLLHRPEVDPVGQLAHHLVEQVDRLGPVGLQRLDDLLSREQRLRLLAQLVDLLDLLVELGDLRLEQRVAALLVLDLRAEDHVHQQDDRQAEDREPDRQAR